MPVPAPYRNGSRRTEKESSNRALGPEAFPLGSPESRAAARLRLKKLETPPDYIAAHMEAPPEGADPMTPWFGPWEQVTGVDEFDDSKHSAAYEEGRRFARKLLGIGRNGDFRRSVYAPPAVWRVLEVGEINVYDLPCCPGCGTAFAERGRYGILVRFEANCADRHDPAPPPPKPPRTPTPEEERSSRAIDEGRTYVLKMITRDAADDIEDYLAWRLGIDSYDMFEYIYGRKEPPAVLRQQIASLVKNLPHPLKPPTVKLKPGDQVPRCPACGAGFRKEWETPFKVDGEVMTYYAPACFCSVLHPEILAGVREPYPKFLASADRVGVPRKISGTIGSQTAEGRL